MAHAACLLPHASPVPGQVEGKDLGTQCRGARGSSRVLYIHCRGDLERGTDPSQGNGEEDWNTGLPELRTPRLSNYHALFLNESPCPYRSVCCRYVHQIMMLWGRTLRAIGASSKGIQREQNEIMHLNWVSPYITRKSNYISKIQTALFPWY